MRKFVWYSLVLVLCIENSKGKVISFVFGCKFVLVLYCKVFLS